MIDDYWYFIRVIVQLSGVSIPLRQRSLYVNMLSETFISFQMFFIWKISLRGMAY